MVSVKTMISMSGKDVVMYVRVILTRWSRTVGCEPPYSAVQGPRGCCVIYLY